MTNEIRLAQFFEIKTAKSWDNISGEFKDGSTYRYQNYFIKQTITFGGEDYDFAPFQVQNFARFREKFADFLLIFC